uniref:Glutathione S-transferase omega n=1 Tax=Phallusia mammillata TaxID=59560 RepID=A0A6F9DEV8_9ASCI|nr:glutathione S-transferase omega-1-like [Phallusia mammillata]
MAGMGYGRHFATGSKAPPSPKQDVLRVYSMKFCPFAQRLKLVLAAKGVKHETVNIDLSKKPEWYLEKNPRGLVPTIEINGEIIYESDITASYVDAVYSGRKLTTQDPMKKAKELILFGDNGKTVAGFYAVITSPDNKEKQAEGYKTLNTGLEKLDKFLSEEKTTFVGGEEPGFTDYMIWPHLERLSMYVGYTFSEYPNVKKYFDNMRKDKAVQACRLPNELHEEFRASLRAKNTCYDIGIVEEYNFD